MPVFLLCILPFIATTKAILQGKLSKGKVKNITILALFVGIQLAIASVYNFVVYVRSVPSNLSQALVIALISAVLQVGFQLSYMLALKSGALSKTNVILDFNIVFPLLSGILFFDESLSPLKCIGLVAMAVAFVLIPKETNEKVNFKWLVYALVSFACSGINNALLTAIAKDSNLAPNKSFILAFAFLFASIICFVLFFVLRCVGKNKTENQLFDTSGVDIKLCLSAMLIGVFVGVYNSLALVVLKDIPATVYYPVISVSIIVLSTLGGVAFFKEKISLKSVIGIIFAIVAVVLITNS